jgi:hypothetical protein
VDDEPMFMIRPPPGCRSMVRNASRQARNTAVRFGPMVLFHSSRVTSVTGGDSESRPALFTSRSTDPQVSLACAKKSITDCSSVTSATTASAV